MSKMIDTELIDTPEMAAIFRLAWIKADKSGLVGMRVQAGLSAVRKVLETDE